MHGGDADSMNLDEDYFPSLSSPRRKRLGKAKILAPCSEEQGKDNTLLLFIIL